MSDQAEQVTVEITKNGPYVVRGLKKLIKSNGETIETRPTMSLCRCGASHGIEGFEDDKN